MPKLPEPIDTTLPITGSPLNGPHDSFNFLPVMTRVGSRTHSFTAGSGHKVENSYAEQPTARELFQSLHAQARLSTPIGASHQGITRTISAYFADLSPAASRAMQQPARVRTKSKSPGPELSAPTLPGAVNTEQGSDTNPKSSLVSLGPLRESRRILTWDSRRESKGGPLFFPSVSSRTSFTGSLSSESADCSSHSVETSGKRPPSPP